jgi:hypothetical protein
VEQGVPDNSLFDDAKSCRHRAAECRQEAERATSHSLMEHYLELASAWDRMAADLEYTQSFTDVMCDMAADFRVPSKPSPKAA